MNKSLLWAFCVVIGTSSISGCGSTSPVKSNSSDTVAERTSQSSTSHLVAGTTNYSNLLQSIGLLDAFQLGKVQERVSNGKVVYIEVPLYPKFDNKVDDKPDELVGREDLLARVGKLVANKINQDTDLSESDIKTVIKLEKCEVWVVDGNVKQRCDREAGFAVLTPQKELIEKLVFLLEKYSECSRGSSKCQNALVDKETIEDFCRSDLLPSLVSYRGESKCDVSEGYNSGGMETYTINEIKTQGYITMRAFEKFSVTFDLARNEDNEAIGLISIKGSYERKSTLGSKEHPNIYHDALDSFSDPGLDGLALITKAEKKIRDQFNVYLKKIQGVKP